MLDIDPARLSFSHYCARSARLSEVAEACAAAGLGGVAVTESPAPDLTEPRAVRELLDGLGLRCSSVNSGGYFLQGRDSGALLELAVSLGAPLNVIDGGLPASRGPSDLAAARARVEAGVHELAEQARAVGASLSLEAIHPGAVMGKGVVSTLSMLGRLLTDLPDLSATLDLYHSWWDPDLTTFVEDFARRIAVVQVCGLRTSPTDEVQRSPNPRDGSTLRESLVVCLEQNGYTGPYEIEYFTDDDAVAVTRRTHEWRWW